MNNKRKHSATFPAVSPPASPAPPFSTAATRVSAQNYPRKRVSIAVCSLSMLLIYLHAMTLQISARYVGIEKHAVMQRSQHARYAWNSELCAHTAGQDFGTGTRRAFPVTGMILMGNVIFREPAREISEAIPLVIEERLERIEHSLNTLVEQSKSHLGIDTFCKDLSSPQGGGTTKDHESPSSFHTSRQHHRPQFCDGARRMPSYSRGYKIPTLLSFHSSQLFDCQAYNLTNVFFSTELKGGEDFFAAIETASDSDSPVDLSPRTCWTLQQAFVENFLRWIPLFPNDVMVKHLCNASKAEYIGNCPSTCLVMFIHAIGALSEDRSLYRVNAHDLAGFSYFIRAYKTLGSLPPASQEVTVIQCRILFA
jgi:hypothetical protein